MQIKERISNVTFKLISSFWRTLEHVNFYFTFKNRKTSNLIHEVYEKSDGVFILLYDWKTKKGLLNSENRNAINILKLVDNFLYFRH